MRVPFKRAVSLMVVFFVVWGALAVVLFRRPVVSFYEFKMESESPKTFVASAVNAPTKKFRVYVKTKVSESTSLATNSEITVNERRLYIGSGEAKVLRLGSGVNLYSLDVIGLTDGISSDEEFSVSITAKGEEFIEGYVLVEVERVAFFRYVTGR
jgi:hypothetical protein